MAEVFIVVSGSCQAYDPIFSQIITEQAPQCAACRSGNRAD